MSTPDTTQPLGLIIKQLHQALRTAAEAELQEQALSLAQVAVLAAIRRSPGISNAALARASFMTPPSMVEVLTGLEERGFVQRQAHPGGGRVLEARLTPAGLSALRAARKPLMKVETRMLADLSPSQSVVLRQLLGSCLAALSRG